jgi:hypoxanthine-DNA glycosylase
VSSETRVVILGTVPGQRSLEQGKYYAHPRNLFWRLMRDLIGFSPEDAYDDRIRFLLNRGIGLWDVLKHAQRSGSLDSNIVGSSEVPNDFRSFIQAYEGVRALGFNGQKAKKAFERHVLPRASDALVGIGCLSLPSTSPANTTMTYEEKLRRWRVILKYRD